MALGAPNDMLELTRMRTWENRLAPMVWFCFFVHRFICLGPMDEQ